MDLLTGSSALRSSNPGNDPQVSKVVSTAADLVRDLQALTLVQDQLGRVARAASQDAQTVVDDPTSALERLCTHLKELICSYVYTYDDQLSPHSEIPRVQTFTAPDHEKDPEKLLEAVTVPLSVPAIPGNLFYLACGDNLQTHNPTLYNVLTDSNSLKGRAQNPDKSDAELVADLMPLYTLPDRNNIDPELLQRWSDLLSLDAEDTWLLDGDPITVQTEADEVIAIAGLQTIADYRAFTALRLLDKRLSSIDPVDARRLVSLYQQDGQDPNHQGTWLARGRLATLGRPSVVEALMGLLNDRRTDGDYSGLFAWLGSTPINDPTPDIDMIDNDAVLDALQSESIAYVLDLRDDLLGAFEVSLVLSEADKALAFKTKFLQWHDTLRNRGGVLGFEAIALVAALTALDRVKRACELNQTDEDIEAYASDGLRLSSYVSNAGPLREAFQALRG